MEPKSDTGLPEENVEERGDVSHDLDLVTVFEEIGADAEMEALAVRGMLESAGMSAVLVGATALPNLTFRVQVPRTEAEEAKRLIDEAQARSDSGKDFEAPEG